MDWMTLNNKACRYWEMWLPRRTKQLKDAEQFDAAIRTAVAKTQSEIVDLLEKGYPEHEAKDVVLPKYIYLKPEPPDF